MSSSSSCCGREIPKQLLRIRYGRFPIRLYQGGRRHLSRGGGGGGRHLSNSDFPTPPLVAPAAGSTAYNLAAGGPAVHPELAAMVVTPLYPHQAVPFSSVRFSLAVPLDRSLVFVAEDLPKRGMRLVADGRPLDGASRVEVLDSARRITLLRAENMGFAEVLSRKIIGG